MPHKRSRWLDPQHWEAVRLSWKSHHIPIGTILLVGLAVLGVLSAVLSLISDGPANPIR